MSLFYTLLLTPCQYFFFLPRSRHHPYLHSFPTRRSSDLHQPAERVLVHAQPLFLGHLQGEVDGEAVGVVDRKSTRLNSSHVAISYAVFCLKKKNWTNDG